MAEEEREEGEEETRLRLTIISARDLKLSKLIGTKTKSFALAWTDPRLKRSTKPTSPSNSSNRVVWNDSLAFPISLEALRNPNTCLTIQLISVSHPMKMIRRERLIGSAILPLADVRFHRLDFTLQVWRPSGRAQGLLLVSAWIDCDLRISPSCVTGIPVEFGPPPPMTLDPTDVDDSGGYAPSAPLDMDSSTEEPETEEGIGFELELELEMDSNSMDSLTEEPETEIGFEADRPATTPRVETLVEPSDLRSLLIGFVGGAVAVAATAAIVLARKR